MAAEAPADKVKVAAKAERSAVAGISTVMVPVAPPSVMVADAAWPGSEKAVICLAALAVAVVKVILCNVVSFVCISSTGAIAT